MTYTLHKLASGSYDLHLDGELMGGVVRLPKHSAIWVAEFLADLPPEMRPQPFTQAEHTFSTFEEVQQWLGGARVEGAVPLRAA